MPDTVMTPAPKPSYRAAPTGFEPDEHDRLLQEYAERGAVYGPLWSKYGPGNVTERQFKALVSAVAVGIRSAAVNAETKTTESQIEQEANADKRIGDFLRAAEDGRLAFQQAEIEMTLIQERLRHLDATIRRGI
jgi:hypothetical protein